MRMKRAERSTILGANRRLAKCQELHAYRKIARALHACSKYIGRRQKAVLYLIDIGNERQIPRASHQLSCFVSASIFVKAGQVSNFSFVLRTQRADKCSTTCWLSPTLSACLRCRAMVGTYFGALCRADCALLCAVYAVVARRQYARSLRKGPRKQKFGKRRLLFQKRKGKREKARWQVIKGVVQVGALRGQRGVNGAR